MVIHPAGFSNVGQVSPANTFQSLLTKICPKVVGFEVFLPLFDASEGALSSPHSEGTSLLRLPYRKRGNLFRCSDWLVKCFGCGVHFKWAVSVKLQCDCSWLQWCGHVDYILLGLANPNRRCCWTTFPSATGSAVGKVCGIHYPGADPGQRGVSYNCKQGVSTFTIWDKNLAWALWAVSSPALFTMTLLEELPDTDVTSAS